MKDYIEIKYPENMGYDQLRRAVKDVWENVGEHEFRELIESMPARCQAVIDASVANILHQGFDELVGLSHDLGKGQATILARAKRRS